VSLHSTGRYTYRYTYNAPPRNRNIVILEAIKGGWEGGAIITETIIYFNNVQ